MARAKGEAADAGKQAMAAFRRRIAERLVEALDESDPALLHALNDVGVVRRAWVEDPDSGPMTSPPVEVVERLLERKVEQKPSLVASLGLSAVQLLSSSSSREISAADHPRTDRLAVMFTDLEGFTRYTAREGDGAAGELVAAHHRAVGPVIRGRGGRIVKRLGDGLLLTFPEAAAAVLAGLELVASEPGPLRLRAGVHLGEVVVLRDDVMGHTVNIAARVTEVAKGGQILITSDVLTEAREALPETEFSRVRRRHFKGLDEPIGICRVVA